MMWTTQSNVNNGGTAGGPSNQWSQQYGNDNSTNGSSATNPEWEKAKKALEAVQKEISKTPESGKIGSPLSCEKQYNQHQQGFPRYPGFTPPRPQYPGYHGYPQYPPGPHGYGMYSQYHPQNSWSYGPPPPVSQQNKNDDKSPSKTESDVTSVPVPQGPPPPPPPPPEHHTQFGSQNRSQFSPRTPNENSRFGFGNGPSKRGGFGSPRVGPAFGNILRGPGNSGYQNRWQHPQQNRKLPFPNKQPQSCEKKPLQTQLPSNSHSIDNSLSQNKSGATGSASSGEWPLDLKAFVQHAFASAVNDTQKDEIEDFLREKLTNAFNDGSVYTIDWSKHPMPFTKQPSPQAFGNSPRKNAGRWNSVTPRGLGGRNVFNRSRSRSSDHSHSRSRSRSPQYHRRDKHRRRRSSGSSSYSEENDEKSRRESSSSKFDHDVRGARGRGRGRGARGRGRGRGREPSYDDDMSDKDDDQKSKNSKFTPKKNQKNKKKLTGPNNSQFTVDYSDAVKEQLLKKRAARFVDHLGNNEEEEEVSQPAAKRKHRISLTANRSLSHGDDEVDWEQCRIIGTSTALEKKYLRLTSAPDSSTVRPLHILRRSLMQIQEKWKNTQDYFKACEQLKSVRQDLTVQCIRNDFTVTVYETHARVAMEKGDHEEYNQCQTQLKALYSDGLNGNRLEFTSYRILYYIFTKNSLDMTTVLASLSQSDRSDPCIKQSLALRSAWRLSNYNKFFKLYQVAPKMSGFLIDWFVERERKIALKLMMKSFRPSLAVDYIQKELAFDTQESCLKFIKDMGALFTPDGLKVDCKASMAPVMAS